MVLILQTLKGDSVGQATYLRKRTLDILKASKVEMILFDEANLMTISALGELARIFNQLKISIILIGTEELNNLVTRKEYIHDRFKKCYRFDVLTRGEFEQMVETLEDRNFTATRSLKSGSRGDIRAVICKNERKNTPFRLGSQRSGYFLSKKGFKQVDKATLFEVLERFE
jgi:DNA transposition AAA+ family ATPase